MTSFIEVPLNNYSLAKRKLLYGIGINDAEYKIQISINGIRIRCPYYKVWSNMLMRCYDLHFQKRQPTYRDCLVCIEWHTFSNFKSWMIQQDWQGKQLDKDLLVRANNIYSPQTCIFVTSQINSLFNSCSTRRGLYKVGVSWDKVNKLFKSQCCINGKQKHLGRYFSEDEAHQKYLECRKQYIIDIAKDLLDTKLKDALLRIANE